jgi:hypothetical protein
VILHNLGSSASTLGFAFYMADTVGKWSFDRITAYQGARVVYARKFDNGMVVVNPTGTQKTIAWADDGKEYRRITGFTNPYTSPTTASSTADANWRNDGSSESDRSFTMGSLDAVFLVGKTSWASGGVGQRKNKWWEWWFKKPGPAPTPSK